MGRPITGTLTFRGGTWQIRIRVNDVDDYIDTETDDKGVARQRQPGLVTKYLVKLGKPAERGLSKLVMPTVTMVEVAHDHYEKRREQGVKTWKDERGRWEQAIKDHLGAFAPKNVRSTDIDRVLIEAKKAGYSEESTRKIWQECFRLFKEARKQGLVTENVADAELVTFPKFKADQRKRQQPTDAEFWRYLDHPDALDYSEAENVKRRERGEVELVSREVKTLAIISRVMGGARTSDLHHLDWARLNQETWVLEMYRSKTDDTQTFVVPEDLRPFIVRWWEDHGKPTSGPMFPTRSNGGRPRADGSKKDGRKTKASYARALRRDLLVAGVDRHELHHDTERTKRVDFHSMRRAFRSSLRRAGVDTQTSMDLGHWGSEALLRRYDTEAREPMVIPDAVMPQRPRKKTTNGGPGSPCAPSSANCSGTTNDSGSTAGSRELGHFVWDETFRPTKPTLSLTPQCDSEKLAGRTGLEPAASGVTGQENKLLPVVTCVSGTDSEAGDAPDTTSVEAQRVGTQPLPTIIGMTVDSEPLADGQMFQVVEGGGDRDDALASGVAALGEALARAAEQGAWSEVEALSGALKRLTALQVRKARTS